MRATLISALEMLNPSRRSALFALVFASLTFPGHGALFAQANPEPLYYIYHGEPKALTLDTERIAVRVTSSPSIPRSSAALPSSLASRGFNESDIVATPGAGWMILNAQSVLPTSRSTSSTTATGPAQADAASVHNFLTSLLNNGDPSIEFVSPVFRDERGDPIIVTPTILIGFEQDVAANRRASLRASVSEGAQAQKIEFPQPNDERWQIQSRDGFAALVRANALANTAGVAYAEPDMIVIAHANVVPTDPGFGDSWGLNNTGQSGGQAGFDMKAISAWDITIGSSSVIVLILDVGVQQDHPDINQIAGRDFTSDAALNPNGGPYGQYDNHGTWVAGCISERINNGLGTAGIAPGVKIASARCYNNGQSDGSFSFQFSWVVDALNWGQSIGARVSNNSNGYDTTSSAIESAYTSTRAGGMVHFASAGNSGASSIAYPSSIPAVNAVGAANRFGQRSSFSQYGSGLKFIAPGEEIVTTDRTGAASVSGDYAIVSGTSFASPYAAGIAALIVSQNPSFTAANIENQMQATCTDMAPAGYDNGYGYGMLNAYRALAPRITSNLNPPSVQIGDPFSYQITATSNPTSFDAIGLPSGLQINTTTGSISGAPTSVGTYSVTLIAHTAIGDASAMAQFVVLPPRITSNLFPSGVEVGFSFSYQITASNKPTSFSATTLPDGLQLDSVSGVISGQPVIAGTFPVTVTAYGAVGDATAVVHIWVLPRQITSALYPRNMDIGTDFSYQITADNHPTSFSVLGLPPGLVFDPSTGTISGTANISGVYDVTVFAHGDFGDASGTVTVTVNSLPTIDVPLKTIPLDYIFGLMIADTNRPRIYIMETSAVAVLDVATLTIIARIQLPHAPNDMCMSADGSKLWFAYDYFGSVNALGSLDLNALTVSADLPIQVSQPQMVREGLGNRFYVTDLYGKVFQIDGVSGATQSQFWASDYTTYDVSIETSPNRKTLYVCQRRASPHHLLRFDVSTSTPKKLQEVSNVGGDSVFSIALSHSGNQLAVLSNFYETDNGTPMFSAADLTKLLGNFYIDFPVSMAFNADDSVFYEAGKDFLGAFDTKTFQLLRKIRIDPYKEGYGLVVDSTNSFLFSLAEPSYGPSRVSIYPLKSQPLPPHVLTNVSTRSFVQTGDNVEIGGFIIHGDQPKKVVLRAIGPSLKAYGLPAVTDPVLELHDSTGAVIATNDNWNSHRLDVLSTGRAPQDEHESVIVTTLTPGVYTAILRGLNGATGTALFELYDVDPTNSKVYNISTRANVGTGDNVMIGGFIIGGDQPTKVIVRAIGPSLAQYGLQPLADPTLELHDGNGHLIYQNDDWQSSQRQEINDARFAPPDTRESAIIQTLQPGPYTAIVRGKNNTTGVALVEVYNLETN